jgi:thioredoxin 1
MKSFEEHINGPKPVLVDFYADWCSPCKLMPPILKEVKEKMGDKVTILKLDVDKSPDYSGRFGVQSIPTLIIFRQGKVMWRKSGVVGAPELLNQLSRLSGV